MWYCKIQNWLFPNSSDPSEVQPLETICAKLTVWFEEETVNLVSYRLIMLTGSTSTSPNRTRSRAWSFRVHMIPMFPLDSTSWCIDYPKRRFAPTKLIISPICLGWISSVSFEKSLHSDSSYIGSSRVWKGSSARSQKLTRRLCKDMTRRSWYRHSSFAFLLTNHFRSR